MVNSLILIMERDHIVLYWELDKLSKDTILVIIIIILKKIRFNNLFGFVNSIGLLDMCVGEIYKLTVPSDLAYGDRGSPPVIPPKSTLVFTVELVKIEGRIDGKHRD
jgi:hypothetical protein